MLKYCLYPNNLAPEKNQYLGKVITYGTVTEDKMIDRLYNRGTTLTKTDIKAVLMLLTEEIENCMVEGEAVNLPFANFLPVIKGVFHQTQRKYRYEEHQLSCSVSLGKSLRQLHKRKYQVKRISLPGPYPKPKALRDFESQTENEIITPGGVASLMGDKLTFDITDTRQGIFLFKDSNKFRINTVAEIKAKKVIFSIPRDLPPGEYGLLVRSQYGSEVREGRIGIYLIVKGE